MRAKIVLVSGLIASALSFSGCKPKDGNCDTTEDCKGEGDKWANDVCVSGKCVECGADTDCKSGFVCKNQTCQPKPECAGPADCGTGKICQNEKCVPGCTSDSGCAGGKCVNGQCKAATGACSSTADCPSGQTCQNGTCAAPVAAQGPCQLKRVNFGFNESSLDGTAESALKDDADCIEKRKIAVTLEGNCDERGTEEYNLHLGERRAVSAKKYLQTMGVEGSKLKTISYGKERPANPGHDEAAWAENRRVDLVEH